MTIVTKSDRRCQPPSDAEVREVTLTEPPGPTDTPATDLSAAEGLSRNNNPDWVRDLVRSPYGKALIKQRVRELAAQAAHERGRERWRAGAKALARRAERAAVAARPSLAELRIQLAQLAQLAQKAGNPEGPGGGVRLVEPRGEAPVRGVKRGAEPPSGDPKGSLSLIPTNYAKTSCVSPRWAERTSTGGVRFNFGQRILVGQAQIGLDGGAYECGPGPKAPEPEPKEPEPEPKGTWDDPLPAPDPSTQAHHDLQTAFEFAKPVQLTFQDWQESVARQMAGTKRGERIAKCGSMMVVSRCKDCGKDADDAKRSANCESRTCPSCSRTRSKRYLAKLVPFMERFPIKGRGQSWTMITITVPRTRGTNVQRLKRDFNTVQNAFRKAVWPALKEIGFERARTNAEVAPGGMVHLHAIAYGPFIPKMWLEEMRRRVVELGCGPQFNLQRLKKGKGGLKEVCKYVTKGVAVRDRLGEQTHPLLCAMIEVAFAGRQLVRWYGDWGKLAKPCRHCGEVLCDCSGWECPCCQGHRRQQLYLTMEAFEDWQRRRRDAA